MTEKVLDLGPLQKLMDDPDVSEIMVNNFDRVFVEKFGKKMPTDVKFSSAEEVIQMVKKIYGAVGKRLDEEVPFADTCLADGTRINVIIPPMSRFGMSVTFRKFSKNITCLEDLIKNGTISQKGADLLVACIKGKINIIFSGGTAVGKTTLLQMLSRYFAQGERVISIEDAAELKIDLEDWVSLETRVSDSQGKGGVTLRDLIHNSLHMAPDRLVIGEVRGAEAIDTIQAMATGHSGTLGVVHGNSPADVLSRIETMVLMSGIKLSLEDVRKLVVSNINLVVHLERLRDGTRKVTRITEVRGIERNEIVLNDLFVFRVEKVTEEGVVIGKLKPSIKFYPLFFQKFQKMNLLMDDIFVNE